MKIKVKEELNPFMLILALLTLFVFIVSFTAFYSMENFNTACGCNLPIWVIIVAIASFGVFTGSLLYYLVNKNVLRQKKNAKVAVHRLLNSFENGEKMVILHLLQNTGRSHQSQISKNLDIDKVKMSRIIKSLSEKGLIEKEKKGMTNLIVLDTDIKELLS